jgi:hypothetical protein
LKPLSSLKLPILEPSAENDSSPSRTKYIDTYLCEKTENMFTKNVNGEAYDDNIDNYNIDHKNISCSG